MNAPMNLEQLFMLIHGPEDLGAAQSVVIEVQDMGGFNVSEFSIKDDQCLLVQCENGPLVEINKANMDSFLIQSDETIAGVDCLGRKIKLFLDSAFVEDWAD